MNVTSFPSFSEKVTAAPVARVTRVRRGRVVVSSSVPVSSALLPLVLGLVPLL